MINIYNIKRIELRNRIAPLFVLIDNNYLFIIEFFNFLAETISHFYLKIPTKQKLYCMKQKNHIMPTKHKYSNLVLKRFNTTLKDTKPEDLKDEKFKEIINSLDLTKFVYETHTDKFLF
jgi:hypothetical protein